MKRGKKQFEENDEGAVDTIQEQKKREPTRDSELKGGAVRVRGERERERK